MGKYYLKEINYDGVISFLVQIPGLLSSHMVGEPITVIVLNVMMNLDLKWITIVFNIIKEK